MVCPFKMRTLGAFPFGSGQWVPTRTYVLDDEASPEDSTNEVVQVRTPLNLVAHMEEEEVLSVTIILRGRFANEGFALALRSAYPSTEVRCCSRGSVRVDAPAHGEV